jgi:hypothetical protein
MMAAQDAAFSAVAGEIEGCELTADVLDVAVPMSTGVEPVRLLQETSRRLTSLYALSCPLSPHRERVAPTREAELHEHGAVRADILTHATGRRCARDLAFVCVYSVTIEVCRMVGEGLLTVVPGTTVTTPAAEPAIPLRPRNPRRPPPVPEAGVEGDDEPLPRSLRRQLLPKLFKQQERKQL